MTADRAVAYPIIDGIPFLSLQHAIGARLLGSPIDLDRLDDIAKEAAIYDQIANQELSRIDSTMETLFNRPLIAAIKKGNDLGQFPSPLNL